MRYQFAVGMALFFAIPVLSIWLLSHTALVNAAGGSLLWTVLFCGLIFIVATGGFLLLRRGPAQIESLRDRIEKTVEAELPASAASASLAVDNEIDAIDACMRAVVSDLRYRVDAMDGERRQLQADLLQAHKVEGLGTMATGVAHDLNNLMAAVLGNVSIVLHALPSDSAVRDNAQQIQATASRVVDLTNKIALYSGHCRFDSGPVNLTSLVRENADTLDASVFRGVDLRYELDDDLPLIRGDRNQLQQLIRNLVENGSEAIVSREGTVTIRTGVIDCDMDSLSRCVLYDRLQPGRYVYLDVADTGAGVSAEARARIFDPFFSTKIRGQGMGLSVVLGVARAHNGGVVVDGSPGGGAAFRAVFPVPVSV